MAVNSCSRCLGILLFSLSLSHHPVGTHICVNFCGGVTALSQDWLPGEADCCLCSAPQVFGSSLHIGLGMKLREDGQQTAGSRDIISSGVGNRRNPSRRPSGKGVGDCLRDTHHALCLSDRHNSHGTGWSIYLSSEIWRTRRKNLTPEHTDVLLAASSCCCFYQMLCHFLGRSRGG